MKLSRSVEPRRDSAGSLPQNKFTMARFKTSTKPVRLQGNKRIVHQPPRRKRRYRPGEYSHRDAWYGWCGSSLSVTTVAVAHAHAHLLAGVGILEPRVSLTLSTVDIILMSSFSFS